MRETVELACGSNAEGEGEASPKTTEGTTFPMREGQALEVLQDRANPERWGRRQAVPGSGRESRHAPLE